MNILPSLKGKKILIGVCGGIAAYKLPHLIRLLVKEQASVKVIMTQAAHDFVTPLTLSVVSKEKVYTDFKTSDAQWNSHVELAQWADVMLIAPATANTLAKMATGGCDNLLLATYLSAKCPVFFAPAMDLDMYEHPTTLHNIDLLTSYGNHLIPSEHGELASGLVGKGRMAEPETIARVFLERKAPFPRKKNPYYRRTYLRNDRPRALYRQFFFRQDGSSFGECRHQYGSRSDFGLRSYPSP